MEEVGKRSYASNTYPTLKLKEKGVNKQTGRQKRTHERDKLNFRNTCS